MDFENSERYSFKQGLRPFKSYKFCTQSKSKGVGHTGFEPVTSALSRQRSKPTELMTLL